MVSRIRSILIEDARPDALDPSASPKTEECRSLNRDEVMAGSKKLYAKAELERGTEDVKRFIEARYGAETGRRSRILFQSALPSRLRSSRQRSQLR